MLYISDAYNNKDGGIATFENDDDLLIHASDKNNLEDVCFYSYGNEKDDVLVYASAINKEKRTE